MKILMKKQGTGAGEPTSATNTKLLLHAEDFTDSSSSNHILTDNNTTQLLSPGAFNSGTAFEGDGTNYISIPNSTDFNLTGDFTVDLWVKQTNVTAEQVPLGYFNAGQGGITGWDVYIHNGEFKFFDGVAPISTGKTLTLNQWHHLAITRSGTNLYLFFDGNLEVTVPNHTANMSSATALYVLNVPQVTPSDYYKFKGWVDEVRIVKDQAVWTGNFTPSTKPYVLT